MTTKTRIFLIDNDLGMLERWQGIFTRHGYEVQYCHVKESIQLTTCVEPTLQFRPHIVVVDMRLEPDDPMGDSSGLVLLQELKTRCAAVPVVIYSAYLDVIAARRVQQLGGTFISKSDHPSELVEEVKKSIKLISAVAVSDELNINWPSDWRKITILKHLLPDLVATTDNKFIMLLDDLIIQAYQPKKKILIRALDLDPNTPPLLSTCAPAFVTAVAVDDQRVRDVVRISHAQAVAREAANYNSHILPTLNTLMPVKWNGSHSFWDVGVTMYELNGYNGRPLRSLWSYFQTHDNLAPTLELLRSFFDIWRYHYEHRNIIRQPLFSFTSQELQQIAQIRLGNLASSPNYPQLPQNLTVELATIDEMMESEHCIAVTHGSFHCEYLLTNNVYLWPINFEQTGPSPIFRDFCQLELDVVLRTAGQLANEQATYELMVALLNLHLDELPTHPPKLSTKLVTLVKAFRQLAYEVTNVSNVLEYYSTLLLHALTILLIDIPTLPVTMRRHAYLYAALLCDRCLKVDVLLEVQVSESLPLSEVTTGSPSLLAPFQIIPTTLVVSDRKHLIDLLNRHSHWRDKIAGQRKAFLRAIGIPDNIVGQLAFDGSDSDAFQLLDRLPLDRHAKTQPTHTLLGLLVEGLLVRSDASEEELFLALMISYYNLVEKSAAIEPWGVLYRPPTDLKWPMTGPAVPWLAGDEAGILEKVWSERARFYDVGFLEAGIQVARAIGRVELNNSQPLGTGFLVGPDFLLTNYHVISGIEDIRSLQVRFGYRINGHGRLQEGTVYPLCEMVAFSDDTDLDYALVRLAHTAGNEPGIGYLPLHAHTIVKDSPLYIIQHPAGEPQKIVLQDNWVTYVSDDHRRVQYLTNTKKGSSGAPVCDAQWNVVALHHSDTAWPKSPATTDVIGNEGIPMKAILPEIKKYLP